MDLSEFSPSSSLITVVLLAVAPFVAVMVTSFTKIVVVFSLLRNALGVQQVPPNLVLNGLALILSIFVMYPTAQQMTMQVSGMENITQSTDQLMAAANAAKEPLREFLLKHSSPREREFFFDSIQEMLPEEERESVTDTDLVVIIPAFTISELTEAFQIGFLIFLPFIVIDLVVANILMAMGMMMLSPTIVSLPFKLLLFVLIEGWAKLAHGLITSYM